MENNEWMKYVRKEHTLQCLEKPENNPVSYERDVKGGAGFIPNRVFVIDRFTNNEAIAWPLEGLGIYLNSCKPYYVVGDWVIKWDLTNGAEQILKVNERTIVTNLIVVHKNSIRYATEEEIAKAKSSQCIDKELFVLPKKWYVVAKTKEEQAVFQNKYNNFSTSFCDKGLFMKFTDTHWDGCTNGWYYTFEDYTEITFEQFKKYVLVQDTLKVSDLVAGEIYTAKLETYDLEYTFRVTNKRGGYNACVWTKGYSSHADEIDWIDIKLANFSNTKWLNACILAGKFIEKSLVLKDKEIPERISFYVKYTHEFTEDLYNKLLEWSKKNSKGKPRDHIKGETYIGFTKEKWFVFDNWGLNSKEYKIDDLSYGVDNNSQHCKQEYSIEDVKRLINYNMKYKVGTWYRFNDPSDKGAKYAKFVKLTSDNMYFYFSEYIRIYNNTSDHEFYPGSWRNKVEREATLEEIQQYLPEDHADKIMNEKDRLFEEAKRRYPIGTTFKVVHAPYEQCTVSSHSRHVKMFVDSREGLHVNLLVKDRKSTDSESASVYFNGKWAEIVEYPEKDTPILPKNWCIKFTPENTEVLKNWIKSHSNFNKYTTFQGWCLSDGSSDHSYMYWNDELPDDYTEITFEQFKEYVLREKSDYSNNFTTKNAVEVKRIEQIKYVDEEVKLPEFIFIRRNKNYFEKEVEN